MPKKKGVKKENPSLMFLTIIAIIVLISIFYLGSRSGNQPSQVQNPYNTIAPTANAQKSNCGDLQIGIDFKKEATGFYTRGYSRPAPDGLKLVFYQLTATNKGKETKDFAGYRITLIDKSGNGYKFQTLGNIDKITLTNGVVEDFPCDEFALASASRVKLAPGESTTGCKMFQIPESSVPNFISIYELSDLKCNIPA